VEAEDDASVPILRHRGAGARVWFAHPYQVWQDESDAQDVYNFLNVTTVKPGRVLFHGLPGILARVLQLAWRGDVDAFGGYVMFNMLSSSSPVPPPVILDADGFFDRTNAGSYNTLVQAYTAFYEYGVSMMERHEARPSARSAQLEEEGDGDEDEDTDTDAEDVVFVSMSSSQVPVAVAAAVAVAASVPAVPAGGFDIRLFSF